jgi:hypothetical protein
MRPMLLLTEAEIAKYSNFAKCTASIPNATSQ